MLVHQIQVSGTIRLSNSVNEENEMKPAWVDAIKDSGKNGHYVEKVHNAIAKAKNTPNARMIATLKQVVDNAEDMDKSGASMPEILKFGMTAVGDLPNLMDSWVNGVE